MKKISYLISAIAVAGLIAVSGSTIAMAGTSSLTGWAWSSNVGWISFNSSDARTGNGGSGTSNIVYSVKISTTTGNPLGTLSTGATGAAGSYGWTPHIGWISFEESDLAGCTGSSVASINVETGQVSGWARAIAMKNRNDGWNGCIPLAGVFHESPNTAGADGRSIRGVTYKTSDSGEVKKGYLSGFAWSGPVLGWLSFMAGSPADAVKVCQGAGCDTGSTPDFNVVGSQVTVSAESPVANTVAQIIRSGGNQPTQTITPSLGSSPTGFTVSITNASPCVLSSSNASCTVPIRVQLQDLNKAEGSYSINVIGTRQGDNVQRDDTIAIGVETEESKVQVFIGKTAGDATDKYVYSTKKGEDFTLKWVNTLDNGYTCLPFINDVRAGVSDADWIHSKPANKWISGSTASDIGVGGTNNDSYDIPVDADHNQYKFKIACTKSGVPSEVSNTAILNLFSGTVQEE